MRSVFRRRRNDRKARRLARVLCELERTTPTARPETRRRATTLSLGRV